MNIYTLCEVLINSMLSLFSADVNVISGTNMTILPKTTICMHCGYMYNKNMLASLK